MIRKLLAFLAAFATASPAVAKTVEIWIEPNGPNPRGILEEHLKLFKTETGIDTKVVVLEWGEAWNRLTTALDAGRGPEVMQLGTTWVSHLAASGKLAALDGLTAAIRPERFTYPAWTTTLVDGDAKPYAVPWFVDVRVLMGNLRWLTAQRVQVGDLASVDGFRRVLSGLREARPMRDGSATLYPFAFPGKRDWNLPHNFAPWIWSQGGDFIGKSQGRWSSRLLEKNTVIGIRRYVGFVVDGLANPACLKEDAAKVSERFAAGEQVFSIGPSEVIAQARVPEAQGGLQGTRIGADGILTFPIPAGPGGSVAFVGGSNLAIPKHKAKSEEAQKLLLFLIRPANLDKYTKQIGFLPPDKDVLRSWAADPLYRVVVEQAEYGRAYPNIPNWEKVESALVEMFSTVWALFDSAGGYRDEELFRTLVEFDGKIDGLFGTKKAAPRMTWSQFQAAIREIPDLASVEGRKATAPLPVAPLPTDHGRLLYFALGLLGVAGVAILLWRVARR
jgi:multiple sugar transport system substrate-binding protein